MKKNLKYLIYIVIPIIAVFLCRVLKLAQGEKVEEIIGGIMLGIFLDIILCIIDIIFCIINKSNTRKKLLDFGIIAILSVMIFTFIIYKTNYEKSNKNTANKQEVMSDIDKKDKFGKHKANSRTTKVGGLMAYNINSDLINEIPEEYFLTLDSNMTYEDLILEIGEPSGTVGSGLVRDYWRIDEDKYAVCLLGTDNLHFEIWEGNNYIDEKVGGNMKIQNYIETSLEKLNLLDITVTEQEKQSTINNILQMPSDMLNDMEKDQILGLILDNIGRAEYNIENKEYKLFSNNVYSFDTEVMDIDMMYTIFLNFVNKLSNDELKITDILEDNNNIDYEKGTGEKIVSFKLKGKEYKYIAKVQNDWFDMEMIGYINKILQENNSKKFLYVSSDGWQNCILFYNTEEWAEKFNSNFTEINIEKIDLK